jgi:glucosamine-6-phosphate deaminase
MERKINNINFKTVSSEWDVYFDMALTMLDEIMKNNAIGKRTVMIVPVGPTNQYPILARLVNQLRVSLHNVWFFNMDEYMI